jgi:hypothetical protein
MIGCRVFPALWRPDLELVNEKRTPWEGLEQDAQTKDPCELGWRRRGFGR